MSDVSLQDCWSASLSQFSQWLAPQWRPQHGMLVQCFLMVRRLLQSRETFRIKSIDHTGFTVSSLDDSLKFWVDVLGFKHLYTWTFERGPFIEQLVGVPGASMRLAMVEGPGHMIELLEYTSPDDRTDLQAAIIRRGLRPSRLLCREHRCAACTSRKRRLADGRRRSDR